MSALCQKRKSLGPSTDSCQRVNQGPSVPKVMSLQIMAPVKTVPRVR
jgi:hypothetical protein